MLAFYAIIVPQTTPTLRKALYGAIVFAILSSLTTLFADTFWCGSRPGNNWYSSTVPIDTGRTLKSSLHRSPDVECQAYTSMQLVKLNWSLNFTSEIFSKYDFWHYCGQQGRRDVRQRLHQVPTSSINWFGISNANHFLRHTMCSTLTRLYSLRNDS